MARAVGGGVGDGDRHVIGRGQGDGEGEAGRVPVLPSVTVTSLMLMRGSSSRMVPTPWPSAMIALVGAAQVDEERLVRLRPRRSPLTSTVMVLAGLAGREWSACPRRACSRCRPWRCRWRWRKPTVTGLVLGARTG